MFRKLYNFCFFCFFSLVIFNSSDRSIQRASFGMAVCVTNIVNTLILLFLTYAKEIQFNGILMGVLTFLLVFYLLHININYFKNNIENEETIEKYKSSLPRKYYIIIGALLFVLSFVGYGIAGANHGKHPKQEISKQ